MSKYDNELSGVLFRNENRKTDKHPEYNGSATINGDEYYMNAWVNETKAGKKYFKIKFDLKQPVESIGKDVEDDDLPF